MEVPRQSESRHVGRRVDARRNHGLAACDVELHHRLDGRSELLLGDELVFHGRAHDARADSLGEVEDVSRDRAAVAHDLARIDGAEHAQAVFRFLIVDCVAARHERPRRMRGVGAAAQNLTRDLGTELAVEREQV